MSTEDNSWKTAKNLGLDYNFEPKIGIVLAEWNSSITGKLADAVKEQLVLNGVESRNIHLLEVPGSYELPFGARRIASLHADLDAVICIGCVVKGETSHDDYINRSVSGALMSLGLATGVHHVFGVLTVNTEEQASDRAGGTHGNRGYEWATTALKMAMLKNKSGHTKIGFS